MPLWIKRRFKACDAKGSISWQFWKFRNYKDLYGKPCKRDWMAEVVFLIQMPLTFGGRCNRYFWDIRLKMLRFPNFNMLFQLVLTKFFKSELFSCFIWIFIFFFSVILNQFAVFLLGIPDFYLFRCTWDPSVLTGLLLWCCIC